MPIESRPGITPPGTQPIPTPLPPSYSPPIAPYAPPATGGSNVVQGPTALPAETGMQMNGFFGFVLLMMGLK